MALSTAEKEYVALSTATQEAVWLQKLVTELGTKSMGATVLYEDNPSAICMTAVPRKDKTYHKNYLCLMPEFKKLKDMTNVSESSRA